MSFSVRFEDDKFYLKRLKLPTRYYHFKDDENYIKLLSIGEGIFPKDRLKTDIELIRSNCIFSTESATKIYPSDKDYGINSICINLIESNCEFINDELILYKNSKLIQFLTIKANQNSTFFYVDILSSGRSFEDFDFTSMRVRNRFIIDEELEYLENFDISGDEIKNYLTRHHRTKLIFSKVYIKTDKNDDFLDILSRYSYESFSYTKSKKMIIGVISSESMAQMKRETEKIWQLYRKSLEKKAFNLGKQ
ncbi:urease accessory protein UreD [Sulfurospirillum sp. 1307]|jgi:urease accessory protein